MDVMYSGIPLNLAHTKVPTVNNPLTTAFKPWDLRKHLGHKKKRLLFKPASFYNLIFQSSEEFIIPDRHPTIQLLQVCRVVWHL